MTTSLAIEHAKPYKTVVSLPNFPALQVTCPQIAYLALISSISRATESSDLRWQRRSPMAVGEYGDASGQPKRGSMRLQGHPKHGNSGTIFAKR